jgi:16S rRNA (guanine527-N7)-methyltransferase
MMGEQELNRIAGRLGIEWSTRQREQMLRYEEWLVEEAIPAGGLGSREAPRIFDRHIADSLAFLPLIPSTARTLIDVGSGVGLPGIPLAIARPKLEVTILDRSERRIHLAGRALRILRLMNCETTTAEVAGLKAKFDVVTFRASLRIDEAAPVFLRLGNERSVGLFAWSRLPNPKSPPDPPPDTIFSLASVGSGILDSPAWILEIQRSQETEE